MSAFNNAKEKRNQILGSSAQEIKITEGKHKIRFFPAHNPQDPFFIPIANYWIPYWNEEKQQETKRPHFSAQTNGGFENDIHEQYMRLVRDNIITIFPDDEEKQSYILSLMDMKGPFKERITPILEYVAYASVAQNGSKPEFGLFKFKQSVYNRLQSLVSSMQDDDEPLQFDPFTDKEQGRRVILDYKKSRGPMGMYELELEVTKTTPLTDAELAEFEKQQSLQQRFLRYTRRELDRSIESLSYFDSKYEINMFETPEFQSIINEWYDILPQEEEENKQDNKPSSTEKKSVAKQSEAPKSNTSFEDIEDLSELIEFCEQNNINIDEDELDAVATAESEGEDVSVIEFLKETIRENMPKPKKISVLDKIKNKQ